jgi:hypothetical protein
MGVKAQTPGNICGYPRMKGAGSKVAPFTGDCCPHVVKVTVRRLVFYATR